MTILLVVISVLQLVLTSYVVVYLVGVSKAVSQFHKETLEQEREERTDLYDRLMSKDMADYTHHRNGVPAKPKPATNFLQQAQLTALRQSAYGSTEFGGDD